MGESVQWGALNPITSGWSKIREIGRRFEITEVVIVRFPEKGEKNGGTARFLSGRMKAVVRGLEVEMCRENIFY